MAEVYVFDFDGTLTRRDTLIAFIRHACGWSGLLWGLLLCCPWIGLMKMGLYPNWKAKQRLFAHCFGGWSLQRFDEACRHFAHHHASLLRPKGIVCMQEALRRGVHVAVVSASIDNWVAPFFDNMAEGSNRPLVLGTRIEVTDGHLTGRFLGANCYGIEKVHRIAEAFPDRKNYHLTAFGDSRGDKEMIDYADQGFYKPFA